MIAKVDTIFPFPSVAMAVKSLGTMKISVQEKEYVKKCRKDGSDHPESTCKQFKCANCNGDHLADSNCAAWEREKEILKIKYTHDILFPEVRKIVETSLSTWSYSRVTQPIRKPSTIECHKYNQIEKLHLKPEKFLTLLKEVQAFILQTKQPPHF